MAYFKLSYLKGDNKWFLPNQGQKANVYYFSRAITQSNILRFLWHSIQRCNNSLSIILLLRRV